MKNVLYTASLIALLAAAPAYAQQSGEPTPNSVTVGAGSEGPETDSTNTMSGESGVAATGEAGEVECGDTGETDTSENCVDQEDPQSGSNTDGPSN